MATIKDLIQQGELQSAILELTQITTNYSSRYRNEVILHAASLKQTIDNERRGILNVDQIRQEKNRIIYALLEVANEIEKEIATKQKNNHRDKRIKILFLAANPSDTTQLNLGKESSSIDRALRQAEFRDKFELIQHWAVSVSDLQEFLLRHEPNIVQFSGHGSDASELILEDDSGNSYPVSVEALSQLFYELKDNIRCVFLNACYSKPQAKAIAYHIDSVIGMSKAITDDAAISFATAFYRALGYGRDLKTAFNLGCSQINLENLNEQDTPQLLTLKGDPSSIFLIDN